MNYLELYDQAMWDLDHDRISLGEFEERIKPLKEEVRPTGHWIDTADEINAKYGKHDYKCSKCGKYAERFIAGTEDWWSCVKPNYCPSCGAAMTERENES